jgi:hypothetical protein
MQLNRHRSTQHRWPRALALVGGCCIFLIVPVANIRADEPPPPESPSDASAMPDTAPTSADESQTGATPANAAGSSSDQNSQNSDNSTSQNSDNTGNNPSAPNTPGPGDTVNPNSPLLPSQALNTSPLYSSPVANAGQPSQLSAPALYNTGAFSLSQVSANSALAQAFMQTGEVSYENGMAEGPGPMDRIKIGPVDLKTNLNFSVVSDDNIEAQPTGPGRVSDVIFTLTPAILIDYGTHEGQKGYASVVYAPTLSRFAHNSSQDNDNQNVALNLQYPFQRLTLNATETYAQTTGVNIDSRSRTTQTTNVATFGGSYQIDDKFSVQSHVEYLDTTYSGNGNSSNSTTEANFSNNNDGGLFGETRESWNTTAGYSLTDKLTFGPGVNVGVESPQDSPQQTFEQGLLNVNYQPTQKIALYGQGGVEWRQYDQGTSSTNPVFSAGVNYSPTDAAMIAVSGYQNVEPSSDDSNQTDVNTGVAVSASERLFQRYVLAFSFIYAHTEYSGNGDTPGRVPTTGPVTVNANGSNQDNLVYRPSLTFEATQWTTVALYYQYQDNSSSTPGSNYHDNQFGLSISAQF